jgi:uncharacterized ubiquitin-like protein YukD
MDFIVIILKIYKQNKKLDLEIPLDITVNELIVALNSAFNLGISNPSESCLKIENPIALMKGDRVLRDYKLRNGTVINIL